MHYNLIQGIVYNHIMNEKSQEIVKRIKLATHFWEKDITSKKMFGGTCFLYRGKMCVGELRHKLMVRVVEAKMPKALKTLYVSPMDFTGKPMKEFIFVSEKGFDTEEKLQHWIELGIEHAKLKSNNN